MKLRDKLQFVGGGAPAAAAPVIGSASAAAAVATPEANPPRADSLDALRASMRAILNASPKPPAGWGPASSEAPGRAGDEPDADPGPAMLQFSSLPFVEVPTAHGPLFQRQQVVARSHHVGRVPADGCFHAEPEMLALLALEPRLATCRPGRALYFDTETSGLGGAGTVAFLLGLCFSEGAAEEGDDGAKAASAGSLVMEQLMLRAPGEEVPMLRRFAALVKEADLLVSFNGRAFDWPLLAERFVMNRLPVPAPPPHLDLLHVARRLHKARLGSCRLVRIEEEVLGFIRGEDVDGSEVPQRYAHYLATGDAEGLQGVVDHNAWDVVSMAALVGLYGEPLSLTDPSDLVAAARTARRARDFDRGRQLADAAIERGGASHRAAALRARGEISKARGDRAGALVDFEAVAEDEAPDPAVLLELAKLYEHHVKAPLKALEVATRGTGEGPEALAHRKARLERKAARARVNRKGDVDPAPGDVKRGGRPGWLSRRRR